MVKKNILLADFVFLLLFIVLFFFWNEVVSFFGKCILYENTGILCPGCGTTRMFYAIRRFDFITAFRYNPLVFLILTYLSISLILANLYLFFNLKWYKALLNTKALWVIFIATVSFALLRNFPPLIYLMP